jgi:aspartyl-tRNA(Asn)/glutamyl-tRNA(Gln) amidotransferase subunit A
MAQWGVLLKDVDAVITPTTAAVAPRFPTSGDYSDLTTTLKVMRYAFPGNQLGLPSIAFPAGYTAAGLPISMQATGRAWHEHTLLRIANVAESLVVRQLPRLVVDLLAD